jgi:hypothetical protein
MAVLYVKSHRRCTVGLTQGETDFPLVVLPADGDIYAHISQVVLEFGESIEEAPDRILLERPFISLTHPKGKPERERVRNIIATQRRHGALEFGLRALFPEASLETVGAGTVRKDLLGNAQVSKDFLLSQVAVRFPGAYKQIPVIAELAVSDCLLMEKWDANRKGNGNGNKPKGFQGSL